VQVPPSQVALAVQPVQFAAHALQALATASYKNPLKHVSHPPAAAQVAQFDPQATHVPVLNKNPPTALHVVHTVVEEQTSQLAGHASQAVFAAFKRNPVLQVAHLS